MQCNRAIIVVVVPVFLLAGCWEGPPEDWECTPSSDDKPCPGGKVCQIGDGKPVCRSVCDDSDDCEIPSEACVDSVCRPYAQSCETTDECLTEFHCSAGVCRRQEAIGVPCGTQSDACQSGHCVDGVCCKEPCDATCMTCVTGAGIGDGDDGTCHSIEVGLDPADECAGVPACDGTGACFAKAQGEACDEHYECATSYCVDGYCCSNDCSGLCVACSADRSGDTDGVCSEIPGGKDPEEECAGTGTCTGSGYCTAGAANGMPCGMDDQCASNHCADGVCCATACDTACEACVERLTGTANGTCAPIPEPFDPDGDCLASGGFGCNGAGACNPEKTWSAAVRIEESSGGVSEPDVGMDAAGNAIAVWRQRTGAAGTPSVVRANRYVPGEGWGVAETIQADTENLSNSSVVAVNAAGNGIAAWQQSGVNCTIWAARYIVGHGWQPAQQIGINNHDGAVTGPVAVAIDDGGSTYAAWLESDYTRYNLWANRFDAGVGWAGEVLLEDDDAGSARDPTVAASASGDAVIGWRQSDGTRFNIWAAHFTVASGWQTPVLLESDNSGDAGRLDISMSPSGEAVAVWNQFDGTRGNIWSASYAAGIGWGAATLVEKNDAGGAASPRVAVDPSGSGVAVWYQQRTAGQFDIWASRFEPISGWGTPVLVETDDAGHAGYPRVALGAAGNAVAIWNQQDGNGNDDLLANRWPSGGEWGTPTMLETRNETMQDHPGEVAASPMGEAVAVWKQNDDIWAAVLR